MKSTKAHRANSEGSIYRDKKGGWRAALTIGWAGDKPKRKFYRGTTRAEVVEKIDEARRQLRQGEFIDAPEKQTVEMFLNDWLKATAAPSVRPKTLTHYQYLINSHINPGLGKIPLRKLHPQQVQAFLSEKLKHLSSKTCQHLRTCLRVALNTALEWNLVPRNVVAGKLVRLPRNEHRVRFLTVEQVGAFLAAAQGHRLEAVFTLALSTGARQAELLGLRWQCVDLEKRRMQIEVQLQRVDGKLVLTKPKTEKSIRSIRLGLEAARVLAAHKMRQDFERDLASTQWEDGGFVFTNPTTGTPLDQRTLVKHFYRIRKKAGIDPSLRFHDLRHTCASLLLAKGVPPKMISEMFGHSSVSFTMDVYAHAMPVLQDEAATKMDDSLDDAYRAHRQRESDDGSRSGAKNAALEHGAATGAASAENDTLPPLPKKAIN